MFFVLPLRWKRSSEEAVAIRESFTEEMGFELNQRRKSIGKGMGSD